MKLHVHGNGHDSCHAMHVNVICITLSMACNMRHLHALPLRRKVVAVDRLSGAVVFVLWRVENNSTSVNVPNAGVLTSFTARPCSAETPTHPEKDTKVLSSVMGFSIGFGAFVW